MPFCMVSKSVDVTFHLPFVSPHNFAPAPPPAPPPMTPGVAMELPMLQMWPPGFATHKLTTTVVHMAFPICLDGHDMGLMLPHVQVAPSPANLLTATHLLKSSRKNLFKAATVKMNKTPVGTFICLNGPPMPMMVCGEPVGLPMGCSTMSQANNVVVGMTWASYIISAFTAVANMAVDYILFRRDQKAAALGVLDEIKAMREIKLLGGLLSIDDMAAFGLKSAVAAASSLARLAFTNEDGSFPLLAGGPFGVEITRNEDGKYGVKGSVTAKKGDDSLTASAGVDETGATEVGVKGSRKHADGSESAVAAEHKNDPSTGKSGFTVEGSHTNKDGSEGKVGVEHSHDEKTGETTDKVGVSGKSAAGSAEASTSGTTDKDGKTTSTESVSVTPIGNETSKNESTSTYPAKPRMESKPSSINQGPQI